jgi:hypothetical protein
MFSNLKKRVFSKYTHGGQAEHLAGWRRAERGITGMVGRGTAAIFTNILKGRNPRIWL